MRGQPDTYAIQRVASNATSTNTTAVTIAANSEQSWVIEQIIWSIDRDNVTGNNIHLDILDVTANTIDFEIGINKSGHHYITLPLNGLAFPKGHEVVVKIVDEGSVEEDHLVVIYK
jgi:hypothetical protein